MSDRANLVRVLTLSTGTSSMTLGAAYSQLFMTSAEAGMVDGRTYTYLIVDGNNWELGKGVYTASGTALSRVTVLASRISGTLGTTKITLTGTAQVRIIESADDMGALRGTRAVTGTSDTIANNDLGRAITYSNAASIAASLAQAGASSQFLDGWCVHIKNTGAGVLTITPTTSTINGGSTLVLAQNMGAFIWSDGTNYHAYFLPVTKPGDVVGPASSTDNALVRFDSTTGKLIQNSEVTLGDSDGKLTRSAGISVSGTNTNDSAAAGYVGEFVSASATTASLTSNANTNVTSITLSPGDWDISAGFIMSGTGSTTSNDLWASINTVSGTNVNTQGQASRYRGATLTDPIWAQSIGPLRVTLTASTTYYLNCTAQVGASTLTCSGTIRARRVR